MTQVDFNVDAPRVGGVGDRTLAVAYVCFDDLRAAGFYVIRWDADRDPSTYHATIFGARLWNYVAATMKGFDAERQRFFMQLPASDLRAVHALARLAGIAAATEAFVEVLQRYLDATRM